MRCLLYQYINVKKLFCLQVLNNRISSFNYGPDVTNKPSVLSVHHISMSGYLKQSCESVIHCYGIHFIIIDLV